MRLLVRAAKALRRRHNAGVGLHTRIDGNQIGRVAMKPTVAQHNDFLARRALPGVTLQHNDYVKVVSGAHAGNVGSIVSVEELGIDPEFVVELESGKDARIRQSNLEFVAHD
jgi:ribosomal protein S4E